MSGIQVLGNVSQVWVRVETRSDVIHIFNPNVNLTTGVLHRFSQIGGLRRRCQSEKKGKRSMSKDDERVMT